MNTLWARLATVIFMMVGQSFVLSAQSKDQDIHIGFKGGISVPNLVGGGAEEITRDYKSRFAYNFGGFVQIGVTRRFSIQTGLDYAPQGGKREGVQPITASIPGLPTLPPGNYFFADFKNTAKLHYLEVPVLFKYTAVRSAGPQLYLNAGPYVGVLIKAAQETRGTSPIYVDKNKTPLLLPPAGTPFPAIPFDADTDVTDRLNRLNFGVTGGGGIKFPRGNDYFFIDVRASYGLRTLQKNTESDGSSRTGNLVMSVGYGFRVKGL